MTMWDLVGLLTAFAAGIWFASIYPASRREAAKWVELGIRDGLLQAADIVAGWHIKKGGYGELAHVLREKAKQGGATVIECNMGDKC